MSFQQIYGLGGKKMGESVLAGNEEEAYRGYSNAVDVREAEG